MESREYFISERCDENELREVAGWPQVDILPSIMLTKYTPSPRLHEFRQGVTMSDGHSIRWTGQRLERNISVLDEDFLVALYQALSGLPAHVSGLLLKIVPSCV